MTVRPLDRVGSIKVKLGMAIVVAVGVSTVANFAIVIAAIRFAGWSSGDFPTWARWLPLFVSFALPLALVQVLARGMTSPLREMAVAARRMAAGDREQRVTATSADEVGELARAFNDMAAELAAVDRMRSDLIANVAHELRTPLAAVQAQLENLVYGVAEPGPDVLALMLEHTERLGRLVAQLLDLSRLESGTVPLHVERVYLATLFEAVAAEARTADPDRLVETAVSPPGLMVDGDADRLHQVLANLTANALRHGPPGRPVVLRAGVDEDGSGAGDVVLTVTDEGPGIPDDEVERVFERFYRADQAGPDRTGGAGLGLAIARWIVELHGGELRANTHAAGAVPAPGCTMTVRLPARSSP